MGDSYDVVVVGAGPAGSSAAYIMAQAGLEVILLERGGNTPNVRMFMGVQSTGSQRRKLSLLFRMRRL